MIAVILFLSLFRVLFEINERLFAMWAQQRIHIAKGAAALVALR
jgi:hypothetical protein